MTAACIPHPDLFQSTDRDDQAVAISICQGCPILDDCYRQAMTGPRIAGVVAGLTEKERAGIGRDLPVEEFLDPAVVVRDHTSPRSGVNGRAPRSSLVADIIRGHVQQGLDDGQIAERLGVSTRLIVRYREAFAIVRPKPVPTQDPRHLARQRAYRAKARAARESIPARPCPSESAYKRHLLLGEDTCKGCRDLRASKALARTARRQDVA